MGVYTHVFVACSVTVVTSALFLMLSFYWLDRRDAKCKQEQPAAPNGHPPKACVTLVPECQYRSVPTEGARDTGGAESETATVTRLWVKVILCLTQHSWTHPHSVVELYTGLCWATVFHCDTTCVLRSGFRSLTCFYSALINDLIIDVLKGTVFSLMTVFICYLHVWKYISLAVI